MTANPPRSQRDVVAFVDRKPTRAEKKTSTEVDAQAEGLVLGMINKPRGIEVATIPISGTRRKCLGRAKITVEINKTVKAELKNLIERTDKTKSLLANQLLTQ
jgi:phosphoribosylcarboxyaminoimidazole (NCAIR) mutase